MYVYARARGCTHVHVGVRVMRVYACAWALRVLQVYYRYSYAPYKATKIKYSMNRVG